MYSIGLDISKSTISIYIPINNQYIDIENSLKGLKSFYSKLKKLYKKQLNKIVFVYEPTGNYSILLTKFCCKKDIKSFIINPKQSANYAKAIGSRNKSDKVDSFILSSAIVIAKENEIKVPVINDKQETIKELMTYYKFIVKQRVQHNNHLESIKVKDGNSYIIKDLEKSIKKLKQQEKDIIDKTLSLIRSDSKLSNDFNNIKSIKGVGELSAIVLLHLFIKYPNANQKQIISLTGLDPIQKSSGTSIKKLPKISKAGSKIYRGTLFMSVLSAIRYNPICTYFYEKLKEKGKHSTVAQIAVMRKIILIAFSLYKNNQVFDEEKYFKQKGVKLC